ncbi:MAG: hypothetical protein ACOYJY_05310 [Acutalibacteraceae bacterium]|jgi:hypothetical protein
MRRRFWTRFLGAFCAALIPPLTALGFFTADINTRRTAFRGDPLQGWALLQWDPAALDDVLEDGLELLPAPTRLLMSLPRLIGVELPREIDRRQNRPRFPSEK